MIKNKIIDGSGKGYLVKVGSEGELNVVVHPHPPKDEDTSTIPFRSYFLNSSSNDMRVDGSTNFVDFVINAEEDYDIYLKSISVEIADGGTPALNKFGALTALTNGVGFYFFNQKQGLYELHEGIKTNLEFIRLAVDTGAIGTGADAYLADVSGGGTSKSYLPLLDIEETYGMPFGLRLVKGTTDKLIFRINDNLTALDRFTAIAYGFRI